MDAKQLTPRERRVIRAGLDKSQESIAVEVGLPLQYISILENTEAAEALDEYLTKQKEED